MKNEMFEKVIEYANKAGTHYSIDKVFGKTFLNVVVTKEDTPEKIEIMKAIKKWSMFDSGRCFHSMDDRIMVFEK